MELEAFLSEALRQIMKGVADAQASAREYGGQVNPSLRPVHPNPIDGFIRDTGGNTAQIVTFDIAVSASKGTETKGGVGVVAGVFNLGSSGSSQGTDSSVSRLRFSVPIMLPTQA